MRRESYRVEAVFTTTRIDHPPKLTGSEKSLMFLLVGGVLDIWRPALQTISGNSIRVNRGSNSI